MKTTTVSVFLISAMLGGLALVSTAAQLRRGMTVSGPADVEARDGVFEDDKGNRVKIEAVCEVDPEHVSCWDLHGVISAELSERMRAGLTYNNGLDVSFSMGRKNRYLLYSATGNQYPNFQTVNGYGNMQSYSFNTNSGNERSGWARISVAQHTTTAEVTMNLSVPGPAAVTLPFKEGSAVTYDGQLLTMGGWKVGGSTPNYYPGNWNGYDQVQPGKKNPGWSVFIGVESPTYFNYVPLDKDGHVIGHVDAKGRPMSDMEFLKLTAGNKTNPVYYNGGYPQRGYFGTPSAVLFQASGPSTPTAQVFTTNVDPKYISGLQVSGQHQLRVRFPGLPLDPKNQPLLRG
jgi:hypothetical protein